LHSQQLWAQVEDQVVALDRVRVPNTNSQFRGAPRNLQFRNGALLIGRQLHATDASRRLGWAVS
jgi:hypothetical protein